jgi:hypothetical protein
MSIRQIEAKMVKFIDAKLAGNGAAQQAIKDKDARSVFYYAAECCVGIRESGGNNKGPMVELIQETVGGADREAWCMSFVQTCLAYAELKTGKKSPIAVSEHCLTVWAKTPKTARVKFLPAAGAIIIWQHGASQSGHTGLFIEGLDPIKDGYKSMGTIEGNTESGLTSSGSVERDGGGVYQTKRSMIKNGSMKVVGFLKPF